MSETTKRDQTAKGEPSSFVTKTLGVWSSHPDMLKRQRRIFRLLGYLPFALGVLIAVLTVTNYRAQDFAGVQDLASLFAATRLVLGRCGKGLVVLICSGCVAWGFSVTLNLLWGVSRKISFQGGDIAERDTVPCPISILVFGAFFWLVPVVLPFFKGMLDALDPRLYWPLLILSNICCFVPFIFLRLWISVGVTGEELPQDQRRRSYWHLFAWIGCLGLALVVIFLPKPAAVATFVDVVFANFLATHCPWILKLLNATAAEIFAVLRCLVGIYLIWRAVVHFIKWRLVWVARKPKTKKAKKTSEEEPSEDARTNALPEAARHLLSNLPSGVTLEGEVKARNLPCFSPPSAETNPSGLAYLIDLPDDACPTKDQVSFFTRFVASYEEARNGFFENEDPRAPQKQTDLLLHGDEGSGRTTILLAAALYAAIVRGQRVLYIVPSRDIADRLARRVNARLKSVLVDCYYSAGVLTPIDVTGWLAAYATTCDAQGRRQLSGEETLPPDVLFATPEMVERCFFSNVATLDADRRDAMRRLMLDFNVYLVDDFLEYPLAVRSHLVFLLDKFRLLLATEFIVPQFVVATTPLDTQNCIDILGQRLFGFNRFNRYKNVCEIHPRRLEPYLCGTLVVSRLKTLDQATHELLQASLGARKSATLLYRRELSEPERAKFDEDFKEDVAGGKLKVVSHLYEIEERRAYENIFYLSLTCGDAAGALRLNVEDEGTSVFFRIKMEGEDDTQNREAVVLLPDETATSLRAFHLRSVLQYIPRLTPVEASMWSCLGIFRDHPNVKDAAFLDDGRGRVAVQWYQDELPADARYAEGQIWSYLVLVTEAVVSTRGQLIDFNVLPNTYESIWIDRRAEGRAANRLLLAGNGVASLARQMVSWRDAKNVICGETDLAHAEELICRRKGVDGEDAEQYTFAGVPSQNGLGKDPGRFALAVTSRYRRGTEEEFLYPVKRLAWTVPTKNLEVVDLVKLGHLAYFKVQFKNDTSCRVDGYLKGLMNLAGRELDFFPPRTFSYDSYLTCLVLHPKLRQRGIEVRPEEYVARCMNGKWGTEAKLGFSTALTHAITAAFRQRFSGWSFFTLAPTFYIEGREGSIGKAVMWLVEPANSGRTVGPVLKALFEESRFWREIFADAYEILTESKTLHALRLRSRLAIADEAYDEDDVAKGLAILEGLRGDGNEDESDGERLDEKGEGERDDRDEDSEQDEDLETEKDEAQHHSLEEYTREEREFEAVVLKGLENFDEIIDVSKTAYVVQNQAKPRAVTDLFLDILWNHPEIFYVAKRVRSQYWRRSDGQVSSFIIRDISYAISRDEYPEAKSILDQSVAEAMKYVAKRMTAEKDVLDRIEQQRLLDRKNREEARARSLAALEKSADDAAESSKQGGPVEKTEDSASSDEVIPVDEQQAKPQPELRLSDLDDAAIVGVLVQKARYLHDYIVKVCDYDHEAADTNDGSPKARTVYAVLVRHLAVCEGYTMAYRYLLDQVGIDSEEVYSRTMCHIWNFVKLGGKWYHVDVTWDDPVGPNRQPLHKIVYDHFLLSDGAMRRRKHTWNGKGLPSAEDTRYDGKTWA